MSPKPKLLASAAALALSLSSNAFADSFASTDAFLPIVHAVGATGIYTSDVTVLNPNSSSATVTFYYTPADTDGSGSAGVPLNPPLAPGETFTFEDVLSTVFHSSGYGLLEVQSSSPIIVTSNTLNVAANCTGGSFGQFSPGQPFRNAIGFGFGSTYKLYVGGLPNDFDHRTNATLINPTSSTLNATVELVDTSGFTVGAVSTSVPPFSLHQLNDVFGSVFASRNPGAGAAWRLDFFVNTGNGARMLVYVTVINESSGDPYLVTGSASVIDVPTVRESSGRGGVTP